jgi:hypothetical protein
VDPSNTSKVPTTSPSQSVARVDVLIQIQLDQFPTETSWYIESTQGDIVHEASIFTYTEPLATINEVVTLYDDGQAYNLIVKDSFGDGSKCGAHSL